MLIAADGAPGLIMAVEQVLAASDRQDWLGPNCAPPGEPTENGNCQS
jgi:hypothetical protein